MRVKPMFQGMQGNPAVLQMEFNRKMELAKQLEVTLESRTFEVDDEQCHIIVSAKPTFLRLDIKQDMKPALLLNKINDLLHQCHVLRDQMARDIMEGKVK